MKLKTLKDIVKCPDCKCMDGACVDYEFLRNEAIKWIKSWIVVPEEISIGKYSGVTYSGSADWKHSNIDKIQAFVHFFNLTNEDLK